MDKACTVTLQYNNGYAFAFLTMGETYGVSYSKLEDKPLFNCVHGGLTYSDKDGENWVFGFDYAHSEDILNPPTLEDVEKSCKLLAEALSNREK